MARYGESVLPHVKLFLVLLQTDICIFDSHYVAIHSFAAIYAYLGNYGLRLAFNGIALD